MVFLQCFSRYSLCTFSYKVLTVSSESKVVFSGFCTFQLQLCCTVTDKAESVKGMYPAPHIHEHLATAYCHEQPEPHCEQWHGHHKAHGRVQCAVLSTPRTVC